MNVVSRVAALGALFGLCACGVVDEGSEPMAGWAGGKADTPALQFATEVRVGDIIVESDEPGTGCWYLSNFLNWFSDLRFCHAMLVVDRVGQTGITTIEALNEAQDIDVVTGREHLLASTRRVSILRVVDDDGQPLSDDVIRNVVETARSWIDVDYVEPPIDLYGDPHHTGLYCSMLPWRAVLDGAGIDLDKFGIHRTSMIPFIVTPDELYESKNVEVVHEWGTEPEPSLPEEPPPEEPPPCDGCD